MAALAVALHARRVAARARAEHERLRALTAYCRELTVALVDRDHRIVVLEGPALASSAASAGQLLTEVVPPEKAKRLVELIDDALAGRTRRVEWDGTRIDT